MGGTAVLYIEIENMTEEDAATRPKNDRSTHKGNYLVNPGFNT